MSTINDELSLQIVATLRSIAQEIDTYSRELWMKYGVTAPQIGVLRFLSVTKEATVTTVCAELHVTQQTMAGILQRLESRGLVVRKKDSIDRRKVILALTDEGTNFCQSLPNLLRDQFMERLMRLSAPRRQAILDSLVDLSLMLDVDCPQYLPFLFTDPSEAVSDFVVPPETTHDHPGIEFQPVHESEPIRLPTSTQFHKSNFVRMSKHLEIY